MQMDCFARKGHFSFFFGHQTSPLQEIETLKGF